MLHAAPISLYVHVPFCETRCSYCSFNTFVGLEDLIEPLVDALCEEITTVARAAPDNLPAAHTLYFGGGTPSVLHPRQVAQVIDACRTGFSLDSTAEITLEANPGTIDRYKLTAFHEAGVNRLSIGVQSAQPGELLLLGRNHSYEQAIEAYWMARKVGIASINVDLIYGLPWQSLEDWRSTLAQVLTLQPDHLSLYSLSIEPQTMLGHFANAGALPASDPDLAADMYEDACAMAAAAGHLHYEISNWAQPGHESRHNRQYWLNLPFLGFGPGAHGYAQGYRYWNIRSVRAYLNRIHRPHTMQYPLSEAVEGFEIPSDAMEKAETIILGLRLLQEGVEDMAFARRFGRTLAEVYGTQIMALLRKELLVWDNGALKLTPRAYLISNRVFVDFMPDLN